MIFHIFFLLTALFIVKSNSQVNIDKATIIKYYREYFRADSALNLDSIQVDSIRNHDIRWKPLLKASTEAAQKIVKDSIKALRKSQPEEYKMNVFEKIDTTHLFEICKNAIALNRIIKYDIYDRDEPAWAEFVSLSAVDIKTKQVVDSLMYKKKKIQEPDSLHIQDIIKNHPRLWNYFLYKSHWKAKRIYKQSSEDYTILLNRYAYIKYITTKKAVRDLIEETEISESMYLKNKTDLDIIKNKYTITSYEQNLFYIHSIDTTRDGSTIGPRPALNWQLSLKYPIIWAHRHYDKGLYFFFTNTGSFDCFDGEKSKPVSKKSFMPGIFLRLDGNYLLKRWLPYWKNVDQVSLKSDMGLYHHSNGGYKELSRSILFRMFCKVRLELFKHRYKESDNFTYSNKYSTTIVFKLANYLGNLDENPHIKKEWGYASILLNYENSIWRLIYWGDIYKSKNSFYVSVGLMPKYSHRHKRNKMKYPIGIYYRYYSGNDEFLEYYTRTWSWHGIGMVLRK